MWIPVDPATKNYITYDGTLPDRLYRYRSISADNFERVINFELLNESIYLAGLKDLNDPDEARFTISFGTDYSKLMDYWRKALATMNPTMASAEIEAQAKSNSDDLVRSGYEVPDRVVSYTRTVLEQLIRVACFTTQPTNYSMWANYAKYYDDAGRVHDNAGICIEYVCDDGWRATTLHPVSYTDVIPDINVVNRIEADLVKAMYVKAREWRCEEEWRMAYIINARPPFPANLTANSRIKLEHAVLGVIFGLRTPDSLIDKFRNRLRTVKSELKFKRVVRDVRTFQRKLVDL